MSVKIIDNINDFDLYPAKLLCFDVGSKTIGVAISDAMQSIASPMLIIERTKLSKDIKIIRKIIEENNIKGIIVGLPINMNGTHGPRIQSTKDFVKSIAEFLSDIDLTITYFDERLSTAAVEKAMLEADMTRKRRKEKVDKLAASFILQGALNLLSHKRG